MMAAPNLSTIREQIARVLADLAALPAAGPSRAERETALRLFADSAASEGIRRIRYAIASGYPASAFSIAPSHGGVINMTDHLAALMGPERLADALISYLPDDDADAPSAEERAARVATLEAELLKLGHIEEDLLCAAEDRGEAVLRRPESDPAIVLRVKAAP